MVSVKGGHKKADILEGKVIGLTYKKVGQDTIIYIDTLSHAPVTFEQVLNSSLGTDLENDGNNDIVQGL